MYAIGSYVSKRIGRYIHTRPSGAYVSLRRQAGRNLGNESSSRYGREEARN